MMITLMMMISVQIEFNSELRLKGIKICLGANHLQICPLISLVITTKPTSHSYLIQQACENGA